MIHAGDDSRSLVRRRGVYVTTALLLLAGLPGAAQAQRPEPRAPGGLIERHAERLGLEGEALAQIQEVLRQSGEQHAAMIEELRSERGRLRALLGNPTPDSTQVLRQADRLGSLETRMQKNRLEAILRIRNLLTPEQRGELLRIREEGRPQARRGRGALRRCQPDLSRVCPEAREGAAVIRCLQANWAQLSEPCQRSFAVRDPDDSGRPDGRAGPGPRGERSRPPGGPPPGP